MANETQSENKSVGRAKIAMAIVTIAIIIGLFTVHLWKSNVAQTGGVSKVLGALSFIVALGCIALEKWVRNRFSETVFFVGWALSIVLGLFLTMGGGL